MNEHPKRRRWFQFRLRTLLLAVLGVSLWLSWSTVKANRSKRHEDAVDAIRALGGFIRYDWELANDPEPTPAFWRLPDDDERVVFVSLRDTEVNDSVMESVGRFTNTEFLGLPRSSVADDQMHNLQRLTKLTMLYLEDTEVTQVGLQNLTSLTNLRLLTITKISREQLLNFSRKLPNCTVMLSSGRRLELAVRNGEVVDMESEIEEARRR